jgi:uncharacterized protein (DUF2141 family)
VAAVVSRAIAFAAVVALVVAASPSFADPTPTPSTAAPPTAALTVRLSGLRSNAGQAGCVLYNAAKGFPTDPTAALQRRWCPIAGGASTCAFDPIPAGTYAVACIHDENKNGKLDTGLFGIPTEGTVVSNHAKGFMGAPSFKDASFAFAGTAKELALRMGY